MISINAYMENSLNTEIHNEFRLHFQSAKNRKVDIARDLEECIQVRIELLNFYDRLMSL